MSHTFSLAGPTEDNFVFDVSSEQALASSFAHSLEAVLSSIAGTYSATLGPTDEHAVERVLSRVSVSLGSLNRWSGRGPTVAMHSLNVLAVVRARTPPGLSLEQMRELHVVALGHDIFEAWTADIPAPIRNNLQFASGMRFQLFEEVCLGVLLNRLWAVPPHSVARFMADYVNRVDRTLGEFERLTRIHGERSMPVLQFVQMSTPNTPRLPDLPWPSQASDSKSASAWYRAATALLPHNFNGATDKWGALFGGKLDV